MTSKDRKKPDTATGTAEALDAGDLDKVRGGALLFDEADALFGKVKGPSASGVTGSKSGS